MNILHAMRDDNVFGPHFQSPTWDSWSSFLAALFALPMTTDQLTTYQVHTGRQQPPTEPLREAWLVCGRRAGKSFMLAAVAVFLAAFRDWRPYFGPGEFGTVMIVAADRRQARVIMRYCLGLLKAVPMLEQVIENETQGSITLTNRIVIEIHTASFRSTRGYTIVAALLDELAFWPIDENSATPDVEVLNAIRPGMATIPGSILLAASSPHARRGALWQAHKKHFAKENDPVLVWQATTREMNPSVPQSIVDEALADDAAKGGAEWMATFRTDVESLLTREAVENCISLGIRERPPLPGTRYFAFVDPSGGSADSMTLSIGHKQDGVLVLDAVRERRPPFSPEDVVAEFAAVLKSYRVATVTGDRYGGLWPAERFKVHGITYQPAEKPKSDLYRDLLPAINSRRIDLLDDARLLNQLCGLERRTARGGRDSIDHAPGAHDDLANVVAGVCACAGKSGYDRTLAWVGDGPVDLHRQEQLALNRYIMAGGLR